ncbi:MAG: hypothetical protein ACI4FZ_08865 [Lachnospiraceae bacterium]
MIAYKGFNRDLVCTMGKGQFQYEVGKTYQEDSAKCASTGFHCVEEPIEVLRWYSGETARYCIVNAGGDVHEDGTDKISCTEMTILREVTLQQLGALECEWIQEHPERKNSSQVKRNEGYASGKEIVVVRGKNPKAAGALGSTIFLLKEKKGEKTIEEAGAFEIDGQEFLPDVYYRVDGRRIRCGKKN